MKVLFIYISIFFLLAACNKRSIEKPLWVNQADTLLLPDLQLEFTAQEKNWKVTLLTPVQPVQLKTKFINGKLLASLLHKKGITEGPASICLQSGKQSFFYDVYIVNKDSVAFITKEYRSPKTVNPDSSLQQQRIIHSYDIHRNILSIQPNYTYFFEEEISLVPKVGVYRAAQKEALTSFYIQAGSCTNIPVKSVYKNETNCYYVTAGPLKDKYNNTVANGTAVSFIYTNEKQTYCKESALLNGFAIAIIPAEDAKQFTLKARVNETFSNAIHLTQ
jgi:hypothetical protein